MPSPKYNDVEYTGICVFKRCGLATGPVTVKLLQCLLPY